MTCLKECRLYVSHIRTGSFLGWGHSAVSIVSCDSWAPSCSCASTCMCCMCCTWELAATAAHVGLVSSWGVHPQACQMQGPEKDVCFFVVHCGWLADPGRLRGCPTAIWCNLAAYMQDTLSRLARWHLSSVQHVWICLRCVAGHPYPNYTQHGSYCAAALVLLPNIAQYSCSGGQCSNALHSVLLDSKAGKQV